METFLAKAPTALTQAPAWVNSLANVGEHLVAQLGMAGAGRTVCGTNRTGLSRTGLRGRRRPRGPSGLAPSHLSGSKGSTHPLTGHSQTHPDDLSRSDQTCELVGPRCAGGGRQGHTSREVGCSVYFGRPLGSVGPATRPLGGCKGTSLDGTDGWIDGTVWMGSLDGWYKTGIFMSGVVRCSLFWAEVTLEVPDGEHDPFRVRR